MSTAGYLVEGMTCGYCMGKVHEKVRSLSGVTRVAMDLVVGGQSPLLVMSETKLGADAVRDAVQDAGFGLLRPKARGAHTRADGPHVWGGDTHLNRQGRPTVNGGVGS